MNILKKTLSSILLVLLLANHGSAAWTEVGEFTGKEASSYFGRSVAVNGDTLVIGAYFWNSYQGYATIYQRNASGWFESTNFTGDANSNFGRYVTIEEDTLIAIIVSIPIAQK